MRLLTGRERPAAPVTGGRRVGGTSLGFFLIALGAVLLFAVGARPSGLNLHVVGIVAILAGVLRLLLLPAVRGALKPAGLRNLVNPSGVDDPGVHDVESAATKDVALIREDEGPYSPHTSGRQQDEL
jgi:hypothetical protein